MCFLIIQNGFPPVSIDSVYYEHRCQLKSPGLLRVDSYKSVLFLLKYLLFTRHFEHLLRAGHRAIKRSRVQVQVDTARPRDT